MDLGSDLALIIIKMKSTLTILSLMTFVSFVNCALSPDFIAGFEAGVYVRDDERAFKDYNCPKPQANAQLGKQVQGLITPMKLMGTMMGNKVENLGDIIAAIEVFVTGAIDLTALFNGNYD